MGSISVAASLAAVIFAQATIHSQQDYDAELQAAVKAGTACVLREVDHRLGPSATEITEADRARLRTAVAEACYDNDVRLARLTAGANKDPQSLREATSAMVTQTLATANALITVRLQQHAGLQTTPCGSTCKD